MAKHQTTAHDTGATSLSRDRELRDDELDTVTGGLRPIEPVPAK
jgi:hypothetical protein